jgi:two-component system sensor histidine kinase/response regulator
MGGTVGVRSQPGRGSVFWFTVRLGVSEAMMSAELLPPPQTRELGAIRGARILLVEDNEINQHVASELLQDAGFTVDVAENGLVGVAMAQRHAYDLVLMDMQMPVMDGVSATREMRKLPELSRLRIVAMTANAMQRDRELCLAAGMDDFVAKPIDPNELERVLLRWIPPRACATVPAPLVQLPAVPSVEEVPGLDMVAGLRRMMGKRKLYLQMLRRFVDGQRDVPTQLRLALAAGDWATAERLAHTAKGVAATIGATEFPAHAAALESALRLRGAPDEIEGCLHEFDTTLVELVHRISVALPEAEHA